jgi:UDP-glucose:glycoprotein glucosyltransferase
MKIYHQILNNNIFFFKKKSLLKLLRRERQNVLSLMSLNMTSQQAVEFLASPIILESKSSQELTKGIFDVRDKSEKQNIIIWFNDIEKDKRYSNWPPRIFDVYYYFIFYIYFGFYIYTHIL